MSGGPTAGTPRADDPTEDELRSWLTTLSNWGRWGEDDDLGTLNHIGPEELAHAASLVTGSAAVSCALPITYQRSPHRSRGRGERSPHPSWLRPQRFVIHDGDDAPDAEVRFSAYDGFLIAPHGSLVTHLDAPRHTVLRGTSYNGIPASTELEGPRTRGTIDAVGHGVVGRGVLLDVAASQGRDWLDDGEAIYPDDLEACEEAAGVHVGKGDILFVRTGYRKRLPDGPGARGSGRPGLQAACLPWVQERQVAVVASDVAVDLAPDGYDGLGKPFHTVGMWAMGLWLLDNCGLEDLSAHCAQTGRYAFMAVLAPIRVQGGTGSPTNPLALF